jgi:hypothetical protein
LVLTLTELDVHRFIVVPNSVGVVVQEFAVRLTLAVVLFAFVFDIASIAVPIVTIAVAVDVRWLAVV